VGGRLLNDFSRLIPVSGLSSGYSDNDVEAYYQKHGFRASLNKPYKLEELGNTLNAMLT